MAGVQIRTITASERQSATLWILGFLFLQMTCQIALLVPALGQLRVAFRIGAFAISLMALFAVQGRGYRFSVVPVLAVSMVILTLSVFNTNTNTPTSGLATLTLNLAIVAPLLWISRLKVDAKVFLGLIGFLWFFHSLSATVGVLQTLYPGRFEMQRSTIIQSFAYEEGLKITLADGSVIYRPSGLTDSPGGASSAGFLAYLFGMGFLATSRRFLIQLLAAPTIGIGVYCIYISQVRVNFILAMICTIVFVLGLLFLRRYSFASRIIVVLPIAIGISSIAAFSVGGEQTIDRLMTLIEEDPQKVYASNRGRFLDETINYHIPDYPFGAGLGRWGMMRSYFGDEDNPRSTPIWVEIQFTAWVIDGGIPLLATYLLAVCMTLFLTLRDAIRCPDPWLSTWGLLVVGYDIAIFAAMFSYVPFIGQMGLEFWLFNSAYWVAVRNVGKNSEQPR
jgi:hypothetical protein